MHRLWCAGRSLSAILPARSGAVPELPIRLLHAARLLPLAAPCSIIGAVVDTVSDHVMVTPGVAGGKPRIAGHRITVQNIVLWHERLDLSADEIATEYGLSLADVSAALAYYYDHREEIDQAIRADEAFVNALRLRIPSKLRARLGG